MKNLKKSKLYRLMAALSAVVKVVMRLLRK